METLYLLISTIDTTFIKGLYISILSIMIAGKVLKSDTRNAFAIIKYIILAYAGLNIIYYFITCVSAGTMTGFLETAPYNIAYYLMLLPNTLIPLLLLYKKPGHNKYVLLALSFLMNIGWMYGLFIMYNSDIFKNNSANHLIFNSLWFIVLKSFLVGSIIYAIGNAFKPKRANINSTIS